MNPYKLKWPTKDLVQANENGHLGIIRHLLSHAKLHGRGLWPVEECLADRLEKLCYPSLANVLPSRLCQIDLSQELVDKNSASSSLTHSSH